MTYYTLDENGGITETEDALTWARWFESPQGCAARVVAKTALGEGHDAVEVSTVFLGIDHSFGVGGAPVLWETMEFRGGAPRNCQRYRSREYAVRGHAQAVRRAKARLRRRAAARRKQEHRKNSHAT